MTRGVEEGRAEEPSRALRLDESAPIALSYMASITGYDTVQADLKHHVSSTCQGYIVYNRTTQIGRGCKKGCERSGCRHARDHIGSWCSRSCGRHHAWDVLRCIVHGRRSSLSA